MQNRSGGTTQSASVTPVHSTASASPLSSRDECLNCGLNFNRCDTCRRWRQKQPTTASCRRCWHTARVGTAEQVCRPCLRAIRSERDFEWLADPDGCRPRDRQLSLIFPGLNGKNLAQPLSRPGRSWDTARLIQRLGGGQEEKDDPAFSPPALPGQMFLFSRRRVLGHLAEARIGSRVLTDWDWLSRTSFSGRPISDTARGGSDRSAERSG